MPEDKQVRLIQDACNELRRLHRCHTPRYEGKIGEPDTKLIKRLEQALTKPPPKQSPGQLLRRLMTCFYERGGNIIWSYKEDISVGDMLGREFENELKEYMS